MFINPPNTTFTIQEFIQYIEDREKRYKEYNKYYSDNIILVQTKGKLEKEIKKLQITTDTLLEKLNLSKRKEQKLKREINRLQYDPTKLVAIGLTEGEYKYLSDEDKHYWREYAALMIGAKV